MVFRAIMRSIPAWAGETNRRSIRQSRWGVYPRVGGGNRPGSGLIRTVKGLSPRGRGKRYTTPPRNRTTRSIPAWAGETVMVYSPPAKVSVYPRVGGGNLSGYAGGGGQQGLSPRGRGKRPIPTLPVTCSGSIPAWAGETRPCGSERISRTVYPRVGGGNIDFVAVDADVGGLSPRGRGKRSPACTAWAG